MVQLRTRCGEEVAWLTPSASWPTARRRIDFQTDPSRYRHWKLDGRRRRRHAADGRRREGRAVRRLRAQAQFLRPRRRHRARRRDRAAALRASAGEGRAAALGQAARVLRRRQYPHAGGRDPRPQGQLLQVHQRDAQRHRGRERGFRPRRPSASSTAPRRAAATSSRSPPTTSCWSTTARRRCRCRSCRCSRCCPAPAGSPASPTSARSGATMPTCSAPPRKASRASARSTGGWSTRWCRARSSTTTVAAARARNSPRSRAAAGATPRASRSRRSSASAPATASNTARCRSSSSAPSGIATITLRGPEAPPPASADAMVALGAEFWPLRARARARRRHPRHPRQRVRHRRDRVQVVGRCRRRCWPTTRSSTPTRTTGSRARSGTYWKRVLKRVDLTSRSLVALVEPGSCFAGTLAELVFATDRSYMLIGAARRRQQAAGGDRARRT